MSARNPKSLFLTVIGHMCKRNLVDNKQGNRLPTVTSHGNVYDFANICKVQFLPWNNGHMEVYL